MVILNGVKNLKLSGRLLLNCKRRMLHSFQHNRFKESVMVSPSSHGGQALCTILRQDDLPASSSSQAAGFITQNDGTVLFHGES